MIGRARTGIPIGTIAATLFWASLAQAQVDNFLGLATREKLLKLDVAPEFLKPLVNVELSFIKRVCRPTVEQMDAIVVEAKVAFDAMNDMVQQGAARPMVFGQNSIRFTGPNQEQLTGNPYTRVRSDANRYLKPLVSEEQFQKYVEESKLRDEFERGAAIDVVIDLIDKRIVLTSEQRGQLHEKMLDGWKGIEIMWIQNYVNNPNYLPQIPANLIDPVLNPAQQGLWKTMNQMQVVFQVSLRENEPFVNDEDWIR